MNGLSLMANYVDKVVEEIERLEGVDKRSAFNKLMDYLAVHLMMGSEATSRLKTETAEYLDAYIDLDLFKREKYDFLGEFYISKILQKKDLIPPVNYDRISSDIQQNTFPEVVFVGHIDTGSKAIDFCNKVGKENVLLYSTTKDLITYRICLLNKEMFGLPLFVLYLGDKSKKDHMVDLRTSSINWTYANRWNPTSANLLKTI